MKPGTRLKLILHLWYRLYVIKSDISLLRKILSVVLSHAICIFVAMLYAQGTAYL